jgi:hypothetical protein
LIVSLPGPRTIAPAGGGPEQTLAAADGRTLTMVDAVAVCPAVSVTRSVTGKSPLLFDVNVGVAVQGPVSVESGVH